jgi:hypothetical protein
LLTDKIAGKLLGWIGKNLVCLGRITLAKSVLMVMAIYHATDISLSKWARDKINKIARNFVCARDSAEHASGGNVLVN